MGYAIKPEDDYRIECYKIINPLGAFKYLKGGVYIISQEQLEALKKAGIPYQGLMVKPMTSGIREQIKKDKGTEHISLPIKLRLIQTRNLTLKHCILLFQLLSEEVA